MALLLVTGLVLSARLSPGRHSRPEPELTNHKMGTSPDAALGPQLVSEARARARAMICDLQDSPNTPIDVARERAGASVQQYCEGLMDELVASLGTSSGHEAIASVRRRYTELALEFAKSVRDVETDAARRHAVAQAIQYKVLQAEHRLRALLECIMPAQRR